MNVILFECYLQVPQAKLGAFISAKVKVVRTREIGAALLLASDTFLIWSELLTLG